VPRSLWTYIGSIIVFLPWRQTLNYNNPPSTPITCPVM